jgi:tellurite resistance protein
MSKIVIGDAVSGKALKLDIETLIPSRLLIQANSGGGKSYLLRRLAEQLYGHVQTIILDPEGEFFTLREKYGYVLVGEGGETPCDVRSAAMLAERFLELKASAVCDLYEAFRSRPMERRQWVRYFLNALIDAPRALWHPLIVIVDEAHKFCPQESPKAASMQDREIIGGCKEAMVALSTTGRKRGFCPIWATQRLAKLDKDASSEFFNRLVGMTIEDVDVDRAADLMSVSKDEKHEFRQSLRTLDPGQFYAFGRAITIERTLVKVGSVETRHPESGKQAAGSSAPPMPDEVKKFLPQLSDLPKEAEQKARTEAELKREIRDLKAQLTNAQRMANVANVKPDVSVRKPDPAQIKLQAEKMLGAALRKRDLSWMKAVRDSQRELERRISEATKQLAGAIASVPFRAPEDIPAIEMPATPAAAAPLITRPATSRPLPTPDAFAGDDKLQAGEKAILLAAAQCHPADRVQLSILSGYKKSTRNRYIQYLQQKGLVEEKGEHIIPTAAGMAALGEDYEPLPTGQELQRYWLQRLPEGERVILEFVLSFGTEPVDREAISEATNYQKSTRNRYIQYLQARHLLEASGAGSVKAAAMFFESGTNGAAA